jgi:hypothetical protein
VSLNQRPLSSASVHQAHLHDLCIQTNRHRFHGLHMRKTPHDTHVHLFFRQIAIQTEFASSTVATSITERLRIF